VRILPPPPRGIQCLLQRAPPPGLEAPGAQVFNGG
jgi:hypothetical protein